MENLIFSLNATVPVFLLMVLGYFLHKINWIDDDFASKMNTFVFRLSLPVMVFHQIASSDFLTTWDGKYVAFCFIATLLSILGISLLSGFVVKGSERAEFIQASYRSSAALLGLAFITNIYGEASLAPMMILGSVPLYNAMAVVILTVFREEDRHLSRQLLTKTFIGILKNPIIIGIALGFIWSLLKIPMGPIPDKALTSVGNTATPLGLMAMGASIDLKKCRERIVPSLIAAFIKLVGLCAIFLPIAVTLGFRDQKLIAILVMLGSATTVSSFVMARSMGHKGVLSSGTVVLTTIISSFTLTFWIYLFRSLGMV